MLEEIVHKDIEQYLNGLMPESDPESDPESGDVLRDMEAYARQHRVPIVGPAVGRLLYLLVKVSGARRIFEMGSAIGYSTIWLARAAGAGAEVHYTDGSDRNAALARRYLERAGLADNVRVGVGDSLELLDAASGEFDMIFNDVDKHQYPAVFPRALARVRRGGLIVADNTLWFGRVTRQAAPDRDTAGIREFNRLIYAAPELHSVIIPLRDGVSVSLKS